MKKTDEPKQRVDNVSGALDLSRWVLFAIVVTSMPGSIAGAANAESTGGRWEAFQNGPDGMVNALAVFPEPGQPAPVLYAGGRFVTTGSARTGCITRWHNGRWTPVGQGIDGESVEALIVLDEDGAGPIPPALYAAGSFGKAGDVQTRNIARWNGRQWEDVGGGIDGMVIDIAVFDEDQDGPQPPALFAAGIFQRAGGVEVNNIARWDGHRWSAVGEGFTQTAFSLAVADPDGAGPAKPGLIVGGMKSVDLWDGSAWYSFGWPGFRTFALATFDHDDDGRATLYAAGQVLGPAANAPKTIARWNGTGWVPLAEALNERVYALTVFDPDGEGPLKSALYVAGSFTKAGTHAVHGLAKWDGMTWSALGSGPSSYPLTPRMQCFVAIDRDASGPLKHALCVGGLFTLNGQTKLRNIAAWYPQAQPADNP